MDRSQYEDLKQLINEKKATLDRCLLEIDDEFRKPKITEAPMDASERSLRSALGVFAGVRKELAKTRPLFAAKIRKMARAVLYDRFNQDEPGCTNCGLPYHLFPCDMILPNEIWNTISPHPAEPNSTEGGGGILCPNCICFALMGKYGLACVRIIGIEDINPSEASQ